MQFAQILAFDCNFPLFHLKSLPSKHAVSGHTRPPDLQGLGFFAHLSPGAPTNLAESHQPVTAGQKMKHLEKPTPN